MYMGVFTLISKNYLSNELSVKHSISPEENQHCDVDIIGGPRIFSYKSCEAEYGDIKKGNDYAFTLTYGNMGEGKGRTRVTDKLSVEGIHGVQFKIMNVCEPCGYHKVFVGGLFYCPGINQYFPLHFVSLRYINFFNLELVASPTTPINFYVYDIKNYDRDLVLEPHSINTFGAILQVSDVFSNNYPCHSSYKFDTVNDIGEIKILDLDDSLSNEEEMYKLRKIIGM